MNDLLTPDLPIDPKRKGVMAVIIAIFSIAPFLPWMAFTSGEGHVSAIDPNERIQSITAPVNGFVSEWYVGEGQKVKRGQPLARLQDNDPGLVNRYERELDAAKSAVNSAKLGLETSRLNLERQKKLFEQGLSARKEYEKAKIETSKMEMEYSKAIATATKAETQFSRQLQTVIAPRDGIITRIMPGERGTLIKAGTPLAILTPDIRTPAVEIWVDGNDTALMKKGQSANIQFEGWPSLQIPGWPGIAINTFPAKVYLVDAASSYNGKFRVLLIPDGEWPKTPFLRQGAHAKGYVTLANSYILKEVWRQLTGLPPVIAPLQDELNRMLVSGKTKADKGQEEEEK